MKNFKKLKTRTKLILIVHPDFRVYNENHEKISEELFLEIRKEISQILQSHENCLFFYISVN